MCVCVCVCVRACVSVHVCRDEEFSKTLGEEVSPNGEHNVLYGVVMCAMLYVYNMVEEVEEEACEGVSLCMMPYGPAWSSSHVYAISIDGIGCTPKIPSLPLIEIQISGQHLGGSVDPTFRPDKVTYSIAHVINDQFFGLHPRVCLEIY